MKSQTNPNAFATDFSHRLNAELDASDARLHDCMNPPLERAAAIADLMEVAFELNAANEINNLWRVAQAVRLEVQDAQAILKAYRDGMRAIPLSQSTLSESARQTPQSKDDGGNER